MGGWNPGGGAGEITAVPVPIVDGGTGQSTAAAGLAALGGLPQAGGTMDTGATIAWTQGGTAGSPATETIWEYQIENGTYPSSPLTAYAWSGTYGPNVGYPGVVTSRFDFGYNPEHNSLTSDVAIWFDWAPWCGDTLAHEWQFNVMFPYSQDKFEAFYVVPSYAAAPGTGGLFIGECSAAASATVATSNSFTAQSNASITSSNSFSGAGVTIGMGVTGTGVPGGTTVTQVVGVKCTLSVAVAITAESLTFNGSIVVANCSSPSVTAGMRVCNLGSGGAIPNDTFVGTVASGLITLVDSAGNPVLVTLAAATLTFFTDTMALSWNLGRNASSYEWFDGYNTALMLLLPASYNGTSSLNVYTEIVNLVNGTGNTTVALFAPTGDNVYLNFYIDHIETWQMHTSYGGSSGFSFYDPANAVYPLHFLSGTALTGVAVFGVVPVVPYGNAGAATVPSYVEGGLYFDTTLDALMVGILGEWVQLQTSGGSTISGVEEFITAEVSATAPTLLRGPAAGARTDTTVYSSASSTITDVSIGAVDAGASCTGTNIPANSYVGWGANAPVAATSFTLVNTSNVPVLPTGSGVACAIASSTATISGTDLCGTITVTTATSSTYAIGVLVQLLFAGAKSSVPRVILTPASSYATVGEWYVGSAADGSFVISLGVAPVTGKTITFNYWCPQ